VFGIALKDLLGLTVIAAIITTAGSLLGSFLKDFLFARSLESWKSKNALQAAYRKFRDPILLSAIELCNRLHEICEPRGQEFMDASLLLSCPKQQSTNTTDDLYFRHYKVVSTLYRFCAFLGWLELYRQEITFLDSGHAKVNKKFEEALKAIRGVLADGHLNTAHNWQSWSDFLMFREEQRAIGEIMIVSGASQRTVIGYAQFCKLLECPDYCDRWFKSAISLLTDFDGEFQNFRLVRLNLLNTHLVSLIRLLDKEKITKRMADIEIEAKANAQRLIAAGSGLADEAISEQLV